MISRYFFALCALVMFAAVASISVEESARISNELLYPDSKDKLEKFDLQEISTRFVIEKIAAVLQKVCAFAKNCLKDVMNECKKHWLVPAKFLECMKNYVKENREKCTKPTLAHFY